jgi:hypothetical protein
MECDQGPEWSSNDRAADVAPGAHDKRCPTKAGGTANKPAHAGHRQGHGPPEEPGQSNDAGGHGDDAQEHQADAHRQNDTTGGHNDGTNGQSGQHGRAEDPSDAPATEGPNADHGPKT